MNPALEVTICSVWFLLMIAAAFWCRHGIPVWEALG